MAQFNHWLEFERYAQSNGYDSLEFMAFFPNGVRKCRWLDAYFGFIVMDGEEGFVSVSQLQELVPNTLCITLEQEAP